MNISQMILHRIKHFPRVKIISEGHAAQRRLLRVEEGQPISASDLAWCLSLTVVEDRERHGEMSEFGEEE